ncbi:lipid II:glycine glycyltransferase FemX [Leucobacter sp. HNU]|uniref:lipid II:glycine glycyltransferase FemX n=1 Tax=Leucobacter sp. HNU TaxID=3236805 RepID=UPI003A8051A7
MVARAGRARRTRRRWAGPRGVRARDPRRRRIRACERRVPAQDRAARRRERRRRARHPRARRGADGPHHPESLHGDRRRPGSGAEPRTEDELFASLGKKARYAIKKAARDGITVERVPASDANCAAFFRLLEETAEGRFVLRRADYYRTFWQRFERAGEGQLFFAYRDGELVAGAFAMGLGSKTTYKDGASVRAKTAYGASHALQWEVLRWALERGAVTHDLCGAPPSGQASDTSHPLHGVGQFKTSFAPQIVDYAGAWDLPLSASKFSVWAKIGDRIARRLSLTVQKDPYY